MGKVKDLFSFIVKRLIAYMYFGVLWVAERFSKRG